MLKLILNIVLKIILPNNHNLQFCKITTATYK